MFQPPTIVTLDLEGVFTPEIWIAFAESRGIPELERTTRDEPDYDKLMHYRLSILQEHGITLADIQSVISTLEPLPGALAFLNWLRDRAQVVILSDTFYEFAGPLIAKLGYPTLFCNQLITDGKGMIRDYRLRIPDGKRQAVQALQSLNFGIIAIGDSYNDTTMLSVADMGILFRPPDSLVVEFPQFPIATSYAELRKMLTTLITRT